MKQPSWSDAELEDYDFTLEGRPETDPSLTTARPAEGATLTFLQDYNITPPADLPNRLAVQPYVWCAFCQEPTHWIGWVAEAVENGEARRLLVGQQCAKKKGGRAIRVAANDFKARVDRGEALRARRAILEAIPAVRAALTDWGQHPGVLAISDWRARLSQLSGNLSYALFTSAEVSPPALLLQREVRDLAAEALRVQKHGERAREFPIYRTEYQRVGVLPCRQVYFGVRPEDRIAALAQRLEACASTLARPTDGAVGMSTRELKATVLAFRAVADEARAIERDFAKAPECVTPEAVDVIVRWYNALPKRRGEEGRLTRTGQHLQHDDPSEKRVIVTIPKVSAPVRPPAFDLLETALLVR